MRSSALPSFVPALLLVWASACATVAPRSKLMEAVGRSDMKPGELRIRVRALAPHFSGLLETLADDLAARSGQPRTQLRFTRFKINAIPAMQSALFQPDPVAALVDAWALLAQMEQSLARGEGEVPEESRTLIQERFGVMEGEVEQLWRQLTGNQDVSATRRRLHEWAAENPLTDTLATRRSTAGLLAELTARSGVSPLGAAGALIQDTQDLTTRLDLESIWLPKQARWQGEYLVLEALTEPSYRAAMPSLSTLTESAGRISDVVEESPSVIARERAAVLSALHRERLETQDFLSRERQATMQELQGERAIVLDALRGERAAALADVNRMGISWVDHAFDRATSLVDRAFRWLLLLVGLILLGGLVALILVLSEWRRRKPGRWPAVATG